MNQKQKKSNGVPERDSKGRLFVNLMEDSGFKAAFADKDNKKLLVSMLNHLLPDYVRVKDIKHYRDREKTPDYLGAKKTILDLCCEGEDGSLFDIEVQQTVHSCLRGLYSTRRENITRSWREEKNMTA